jgi:high-affinity iron transporter
VQGIFFGTFLIGLREGLEATLIVSIVGAFLKRSGRSVRPMFVGVGVAVALSVAVGVGLDLLEETLPQVQQEMLETAIGVIAVVFVTTMIIWMNRNAGSLKSELEREAQDAINTGSSFALAAMAFLAVLKEGFETAVFLLAAAQTSQGSRVSAVLGATVGIGAAIAVGVAMYYGALKVNLGRFFRVTGVFLVLIAAGLVMSSLRTAHEAGWITVGQQQVFDFSSWMSTRSVLGALITGMFGIPPDPRLIEVVGWLFYAVPVLIVFQWPSRLARGPHARRRLLGWSAAALGVAAAALAVFVPVATPLPGPTRSVTDGAGHALVLTLRPEGASRILTIAPIATGAAPRDIRLDAAGQQSVDAVTVDVWQATIPADPVVSGTPVSLSQLSSLAGGRLPVGLSTARTPGPFDVGWSASTVYTVRAYGGAVVTADAVSSRVATLTGGGLAATKTVSVGGLGSDWATPTDQDRSVASHIAESAHGRSARMLWKAWLPAVLALGAAFLAFEAVRAGHRSSEENEREQHHGEVRRDRVPIS